MHYVEDLTSPFKLEDSFVSPFWVIVGAHGFTHGHVVIWQIWMFRPGLWIQVMSNAPQLLGMTLPAARQV